MMKNLFIQLSGKKKTALTILLLTVTAGAVAYLASGLAVKKDVATADFTVSEPSPRPLIENSKPEPLVFRFNYSVSKLEDANKTLSKGISLEPPIKGYWQWTNDRSLVFTPAEDWTVDTEYKVKLEKTLFSEFVRLEKYSHKFKTEAFKIEVVKKELYQDPVDPKIKKISATLKAKYPFDFKSLEEKITLKLQNSEENTFFTVTYDKFMGEAYIVSSNIDIPEKDTEMLITVEEGVKSSLGGNGTKDKVSSAVWVPGIYNFFRITNVSPSLVRNESYEPEQVLIIETSAGARSEDIAKKLKVLELPKDHRDSKGSLVSNYYWQTPAEVTPEVKNKSINIGITPIPTELEYSTLHSFKFKGTPRRYIYVGIEGGIESFGGYVLKSPYETIRNIPEYPRELKIMYEGAVITLQGEKKLSLTSRGIKGIKAEVSKILPEEINHLITQSSGNFKNPYFDNYNFNYENISESETQIITISEADPKKAAYSSLDLSGYITGGKFKGLFYVKVRAYDTETKSVTYPDDGRFILVTDMGIISKESADGSRDIFVQSFRHSSPVGGAKVAILGKNGLPVVSAKFTDEGGRVSFPSLKEFRDEKEPVAITVQKEEDISFLPFDRDDRILNLSRFDTGGVRTYARADSLSAYLFSERGIYRPGDEINIGMVVKPNDWDIKIEGMPLEAVVRDSRGVEVKTSRFKINKYGFEELKYITSETSPTGGYQVGLYLVRNNHRDILLGSVTVKVEEFLPDKLKITSKFSKDEISGWVSPEGLKGTVTLKTLFGIPAGNRKVKASISLNPAYPSFGKYRDYSFYDSLRTKRGFSESLNDGVTDENGEVDFDLGLQKYDKGAYRLNFFSEGFDAGGGRGVAAENSILVSPLKYLIGYKSDGDLNFIKKNAERSVNLIAVDNTLQKTKVMGLKTLLSERKYVSVLTKLPDGLFRYQSVMKESPVKEETINVTEAGLKFRLPTSKGGSFALTVKDEEGTELNKFSYYVAGEENLTRSLEKTSELQVILNKTDFNSDEFIELSIRAPYTGGGLITIERDRVYAYKWFKTDSVSSVERIRVPKDLEGTGYVTVAFVRASDSKEIFMSPLSYSTAPFSVNKNIRDIKVSIEAPEMAVPGEPLEMTYKSKTPGKAAIFAVDEGILQAAGYNAPDPLSHFFRKRALEVNTVQIIDLIMPEFKLLSELSKPGGDGYEEDALKKNLNPFKRKTQRPVVFWSGIVDVDSTERKVSYKVPDYFNGTLRIVAVAVSESSLGAAEKKSVVKSHFVITPNTPMFAVPKDEFDVAVSVANNAGGAGEVTLEIKPSKHFEILGDRKRTVKIDADREKTEIFKIKAKGELGSGSLLFTAKGLNKESRQEAAISVRPPTHYATVTQSGRFKTGQKEVSLVRNTYPQFKEVTASASTLPISFVNGLVKYLDKYPYGCTEQLLSKAFPAVVFYGERGYGVNKQDAANSIGVTIDMLRGRQHPAGGFTYWPGASGSNDYISVYAAHFLLEASLGGYPVPKDFMENVFTYLQTLLRNDATNLDSARTKAYAIYLLTRRGVVTTNYINSLRRTLDSKFKGAWEKDITSAYLAGAYKLLKLDSEAEKLKNYTDSKNRTKWFYNTYTESFYDDLVYNAMYIYIMSEHFQANFIMDPMLELAEDITENRYNTISSAYSILALDRYSKAAEKLISKDIEIAAITKDKIEKVLKLQESLVREAKVPEGASKVRFSAEGQYDIFYQVAETGFDVDPPMEPVKKGIEVFKEYRNSKGEAIESAKLGEEVTVKITARSVNKERFSNIAIIDLLPGGFDTVIESLRGEERRAVKSDGNPDEGEGYEGDEGYDNDEGYSPYSNSYIQYIDGREDRVLIFLNIDTDVSEFTYKIKAVNKGEFTAPPVYAESMYDRAVRASSIGKIFTIKD